MTQVERIALWFAVGVSVGSLFSVAVWFAWAAVVVLAAVGAGYFLYEEFTD